jgi:hypothetical protein
MHCIPQLIVNRPLCLLFDLQLFVFSIVFAVMDALDELLAQQEDNVKISFSNLKELHCYQITKLTNTETTYEGKSIKGVKADLDDGDGLKFHSYLPSSIAKIVTPALIAAVAKQYEENQPFSVIFYGKVGKENKAKIHKFGQGMYNLYLICTCINVFIFIIMFFVCVCS